MSVAAPFHISTGKKLFLYLDTDYPAFAEQLKKLVKRNNDIFQTGIGPFIPDEVTHLIVIAHGNPIETNYTSRLLYANKKDCEERKNYLPLTMEHIINWCGEFTNICRVTGWQCHGAQGIAFLNGIHKKVTYDAPTFGISEGNELIKTIYKSV